MGSVAMTRENQNSTEHVRVAGSKRLSVSRRHAIKGLALASLGGGVANAVIRKPGLAVRGSGYPTAVQFAGDVIRATAKSPGAETESGRVRGYSRKGINIFKGIPYGADSGGENRFLPSKKPLPWTGVRASLYPSHVCPQPSFTTNSGDEALWLFMWEEGVRKEDCLSLNIWTPGLDNAKRPVMVWLHGGAYTMGSSAESPSYDGENLARNGDVVIVSLNHRLGVFGYLNLAEYGEEYANSGANGLLDIVCGLEWIRDNIANFGGDPNRVTIFGQSGGGMKVTVLMAMPPAKGLFHSAIVQSGSLLGAVTPEDSLEMTWKLLKKLEVNGKDLSQLKKVPADRLLEVAMGVNALHGPIGLPGIVDFRHSALLKSWAPVAGNSAIPDQPFHSKAPQCSVDVPLIVCTTLNEFTNGVDKPDCFNMTEDELKAKVGAAWPDRVDAILKVYRKSSPESNAFQLWSAIAASTARAMALEQCRMKAEQKAAPAFSCRFDWQSPVLDGRVMALHGMDLSFVFDNTSKFENMTGDGPEARTLAKRMSRAWIRFATSRDPNHSGIPTWKPFDPFTQGTMVWDNECSFREHVDDECITVTSA
jgi:para-nitrobenzyl esterase